MRYNCNTECIITSNVPVKKHLPTFLTNSLGASANFHPTVIPYTNTISCFCDRRFLHFSFNNNGTKGLIVQVQIVRGSSIIIINFNINHQSPHTTLNVLLDSHFDSVVPGASYDITVSYTSFMTSAGTVDLYYGVEMRAVTIGEIYDNKA